VVPHNYGETVWYDLAAFRDGTRSTWEAILDHFSESPKPLKKDLLTARPSQSLLSAVFWEKFKAAAAEEAERRAKLPAEEQAKLAAETQARCEAWEAEERSRRENPHFGDFLINDFVVNDNAWLFRDSTPGVIGVSEHLSMCLADKREVPSTVLDVLAALSAVNRCIKGVGVTWKPAVSTGPQYPGWSEHLRFARTLLTIAENNLRRSSDVDSDNDSSYATLSKVARATQKIVIAKEPSHE
jgi:hypothetical protein